MQSGICICELHHCRGHQKTLQSLSCPAMGGFQFPENMPSNICSGSGVFPYRLACQFALKCELIKLLRLHWSVLSSPLQLDDLLG